MTVKTLVNGHPNRSAHITSLGASYYNSNVSSQSNTNQQYVVSRNGVILTWQDIYQRYPLGDDANNINKSSSSSSQDQYTPMSSSTLLQHLPRGAYTTCRTVKAGTHIYQFDYHCKRLAKSSKQILQSISVLNEGTSDKASFVQEGEQNGNKVPRSPGCEDTTSNTGAQQHEYLLSTSNHPIQHHRNPSKLEIQSMNIIRVGWEREMALSCIRSTLDSFRSSLNYEKKSADNMKGDVVASNCVDGMELDPEFRITLLATWEQQSSQNVKATSSESAPNNDGFQSALYCHIGLLTNNNSASKHIRVLVHGHGRENALAKDSKWVTDRKQLTTPNKAALTKSRATTGSSSPDLLYEEIILINDNGELLEGTQTNFYVVKNANTIITANEGVLFGSVRDSVLRVCNTHGIHVELRPPTLEDLKYASGVFITSTSRWVMEVHEVELGDLLLLKSDSFDMDREKNAKASTSDGETEVSSFFYGNCPTTDSIRKWVLEDVESHSTPIYA